MTVIVCVDDNGGTLFNHRRQSQDRVLRERLLQLCPRLFMNGYSARQFREAPGEKLQVAEDFLDQAGEKDWCFAEDVSLMPYLSRISRLVVCRWNRVYPADTYLGLSTDNWHLLDREEFPGSSHEKITLEVYEK